MNTFHAYMLKYSDDSFYAGHTDNLELRVSQHNAGLGGQYTSSRLPVLLVWAQEFTSREEALSAERQIKGWTRKKKQALINSDWDRLKQASKKVFTK